MVAVFASMVGGVAGYGTGALMPLVLVPVLGPEPVVPIIAISALFNNTWRALAFKNLIDWRRAMLVAAFATPTCILSAYGYTLLTGKGAAIVIGVMLMLTVPLRYLFKRYVMALDSKGLAVGAVIYGGAVGGTVGAGVILLSLLMAAGLQGAAVVATDAVISMVVTAVRMAVFGFSGVIDARVMAVALLIGIVALPAAFMAKALVARMSLTVHTAILDVVVLIGGAVMIGGALRYAIDRSRSSGDAQVRLFSRAQRFAIVDLVGVGQPVGEAAALHDAAVLGHLHGHAAVEAADREFRGQRPDRDVASHRRRTCSPPRSGACAGPRGTARGRS